MVDVQKSDVQIALDAVDIVGGSRDNWKRWSWNSDSSVFYGYPQKIRYYATGKLKSEMERISKVPHRHFFGIAIDRSGRIAVECCECAESVRHAKSIIYLRKHVLILDLDSKIDNPAEGSG